MWEQAIIDAGPYLHVSIRGARRGKFKYGLTNMYFPMSSHNLQRTENWDLHLEAQWSSGAFYLSQNPRNIPL